MWTAGWDAFQAFYPGAHTGGGEGHTAEVCGQGMDGLWTVPHPKAQLTVGTLQAFLDAYCRDHPEVQVDYIHGDDVARKLGSRPGNLGFLLPLMGKEQLFPTVMADGVLPRKTFSMGEARDKRYYLVMQSVSLCDTVTVEETGIGFALLADGFTVPAGKSSLEQQAAEAFFAAVGRPMPPLTVHLEKTTPAYAGLGGGSADVAALLRCLRRQYAPEMPVEQLRAIGLTVGSDMPFCVSGGTALAEGRGERLTALPALPDCWIVLCKPEFGIPTPALFTLADAGTPKNRPDIDGMIRALSAGDLDGVAAQLCNVFEEFLPEEYHEVFHIKNRLLELGALNAAMSGSGPTVFGLFREKTAAKAALTALKQRYPQTYLAKSVGELV